MPKRSLRLQLLQQRQALSPELRESFSSAAQQRLLALPEYRDSRLLALYSPVRNEVLTDMVAADARQRGKRLAYPRVEGETMTFHEVLPGEPLQCGAFGICEPERTRPLGTDEISLVVVPGVAYDLSGHRLGYGKGYYDRLWGHGLRQTLLIGLAYEFQLVSQLPREGHDLCLDLLVTEQRLLRFRA